MVRGFILLLRLKNKNKVFKKSVNYFLTFMKDAEFSFFQKKSFNMKISLHNRNKKCIFVYRKKI